MKVLIVDDQELARTGLRFGLQDQAQITVVGEAENGEDAIASAASTNPDVILMDIMMPGMNGIVATQNIKKQFPETKVVMLTSSQVDEEIFASLAAGADAFCLKTIKMSHLMQVLEVVAAGGIWLDPAVATLVIQNLPRDSAATQGPKTIQKRQRYQTNLTDREYDVLTLIAQGMSNKEIAAALVVTIHTVKIHVSNIIQKLAVDDRTQVAIKALQEGLIAPSSIQPEKV